MIRAYDRILLGRAENTLGHMLDFAVHSLHMDIRTMMGLFSASGAAALFEHGDIHVICGMSGAELAYEVLERSGIPHERVSQRHTLSLSAEYWAGYAMAATQYVMGLPFSEIEAGFDAAAFTADYAKERAAFLDGLPFDISAEDRADALRGFGKEYVDKILRPASLAQDDRAGGPVPLKAMRIKNGLSQSALAEAAGIPVRTLQQYEQRQKDLSKARAEYLVALAMVLRCEPAELLRRKAGAPV